MLFILVRVITECIGLSEALRVHYSLACLLPRSTNFVITLMRVSKKVIIIPLFLFSLLHLPLKKMFQ